MWANAALCRLPSRTPSVNSHDVSEDVSEPSRYRKPTSTISAPKRWCGRRHQA
jgi:hypothetical protein